MLADLDGCWQCCLEIYFICSINNMFNNLNVYYCHNSTIGIGNNNS